MICDLQMKHHVEEANQPEIISRNPARGQTENQASDEEAKHENMQKASEMKIEAAKEPSKPDLSNLIVDNADESRKVTAVKLRRLSKSNYCRYQFKTKLDMKDGIEGRNRFECLQENLESENTLFSKDTMAYNIFVIGNRSIFTSRRSRCNVQARTKYHSKDDEERDERDQNKASQGLSTEGNYDQSKQKVKNNNDEMNHEFTMQRNNCGLTQFETSNAFSTLIDNDEERFDNIIKRIEIMNTRRSNLKKCRKCGYKKRSCVLNPANCNAMKKLCFKCNKSGHFPKSIDCRGSKSTQRMRMSKQSNKQNSFKSEQFRKDVLLLINQKLDYLKVVKQIEESLQKELIIFFLMFCCLNNDCFVRSDRDHLLPPEYCQVESHTTTDQQTVSNPKSSYIRNGIIASNQEKHEEHLCHKSGSTNVVGLKNGIKLLGGFDVKRIYGINCEINNIIQMINFVRSFNFLWITRDMHWMCHISQDCFFCCLRSSCLRLRQEREKGPKLLQLNEYVNQLHQYDSLFGYNWRDDSNGISSFVENTLKLINNREDINNNFTLGSNDCQECKKNDSFILRVKIEDNDNTQDLNIPNLLEKALVQEQQKRNCSHGQLLAFVYKKK